jgi:hypothetical protein
LLLLTSLAVPLPAGAQLPEGFWEDNVEIHGKLSSRLYFRSPGLNFSSNDVQLSSWRNELEIETYVRLPETGDFASSLTILLRPTYEAAYDAYEVWGERPRGGEEGTSARASQRRALKGRRFNGRGKGIRGEYYPVNQDLETLFEGDLVPGLALNPNLVLPAVAPWAARGSRQGGLGGKASGRSFEAAINSWAPGATELARSLALASEDLGTPLNRYAGALGDRNSLDQLPAGINETEDRLKFDCFDGANETCWLREAYLDLEYKDTFARLGRQIIAWGKADSFQLQDVINPLDNGLHNIFPSLEERRIPQWSLLVSHSVGSIGPIEDIAVDFAWVLDRFTPQQLGQCGEQYTFTIGCQMRMDAGTHEALNLSLAEVDERHWTLGNTEPGLRVEFSVPSQSMSFSISAFWGFQDLPVLEAKNRYSVENPNSAAMLSLQAAGAGPLLDFLANGPGACTDDPDDPANAARPWRCGFDPYARDDRGRPVDTFGKANADLLRVWETQVAPRVESGDDIVTAWKELEESLTELGADRGIPEQFEVTQGLMALPWSGSELVAKYPRVLTLGASMDWEVTAVEAVVRMEVALDIDRGITNTAKSTLEDSSDVFKGVIGIDRPMEIPFLFTSRPTFVTMQLFWERILDYENGNGRGDGMINPRDTLISTFYTHSYWLEDRLELSTFVVADWTHQSWAIGPKVRWELRESMYVDVGVNLLMGRSQEHGFVNVCKDGGVDCVGDPTTWRKGQTQTTNRGLRRQAAAPWFLGSFADSYMEQRDEVWFGVTWEF